MYLIMAGTLVSCNPSTKKSDMNPFFESWNTPFEVPPFDKIENPHYLPAFEKGMSQHKSEIDAIVNNAESPTFSNTIETLDYSGDLLTRVGNVFFNVKEAHTNDEMDQIAETIAPKLSQHRDAINLNEKLFERVKVVFEARASLDLNPEQQRLLSETHKSFVRGGANLPADKKEELKKINEQLSILELKFGQNMLAETNSFRLIIENESDLAGLPESVEIGRASCRERV